MKKILLTIATLLFALSCTSGKVTSAKTRTCSKNKKVICEKPNAPVLEAMDDSEISANIKSFGATYKDNRKVVYDRTETSELNQCIAVYQYYNCKAYCESDSLTIEDKIGADERIINDCRDQFIKKDIAKRKKEGRFKTDGTRILIKIEAKNYKITDNLRDFVQSAFEKGATQFTDKKYIIVSDKDRISMQRRIEKEFQLKGNDPKFLPTLNKLLAPDVVVEIKVSYMSKRLMLKNSLIVVETGARIKTDYVEYKIEEGKDINYDIFKGFEKLAPEFLKLVK